MTVSRKAASACTLLDPVRVRGAMGQREAASQVAVVPTQQISAGTVWDTSGRADPSDLARKGYVRPMNGRNKTCSR